MMGHDHQRAPGIRQLGKAAASDPHDLGMRPRRREAFLTGF
jgi:hypothetical protein